jgi:putative peptidoglycan lipid II flippase
MQHEEDMKECVVEADEVKNLNEKDKKDNPPSIAKSTAKMSLATFFSRGSGFIRSIALAYVLGDTVLNDTFNTANYMPNIIFELIMGGILGSVIIPVYVQYLAEKSEDESRYMINNLMNIIVLLAIALSIFGSVFAPWLVKIMTILQPVKNTPTMVMFFRIFALEIAFYGVSAVYSGVLNSHRSFTVPMFAPVMNNLLVTFVALGVYLPLKDGNPELATILLAIGTLLGVAVMALYQVPTARRLGMRFQRSLDFKHPSVKQIAKLGLPMLGFAATFQINNFLIYMLLQSTDRGTTAYVSAMQFFQLPYAIYAVSVTTAIFPELSRYANSKDFSSFKKTLSLGLRSTSFVIIPSAIYMIILAKPIIGLTLQHGAFGPAGTEITASVLQAFAVALLSFSLYNMLTRVYYSLQDTKTPMKIGVISIPLQVIFNFLLIGPIGPKGLPLSYAVALTFSVVIQLYILRKKIGSIGASHIMRAMIKHLAAALLAGIVMYLVYYGVETMGMPRMLGQAMELMLAAVLGAVAYLGIALLLKTEEVDFIKSITKRVVRVKAKAVS